MTSEPTPSLFPDVDQKHPCQRCGSDEWEYVDYGGYSVCRSHTERVAEDELLDYVPTSNPDGTVLG